MSQQLENYIKELKRVYYLTSSMQKYTDLKQQLQLMLKECISLTKATSGSIMFRHKQSDNLFFYVEEGLDATTIAQTQLKVGDGISGTVVSEGIPKIVNDITLDPKYISLNSSIRSGMAVPIIVEQKVFGVINLDHTSTDQFTDKHLELVQIICGYTGFMIAHHIEKLRTEKNARFLDSIINITDQMTSEEIFELLCKELKCAGAYIINSEGIELFKYGSLLEDVDKSSDLLKKSHTQILKTENNQHIPYTRLVVSQAHNGLAFVADKLYYFSDNVQVDIDYAGKMLEILAVRDSIFYHDETLSHWAESKLNAPAGQVYDIAVGIVEKEIISAALKKFRFNRLKTAQFLGINRNTLRHKMEIFGLEK